MKNNRAAFQISVENFNKYLVDQSSYIEFKGGRFIHKPMEVFKITLTDLTENVELLTSDIKVQKLQKIYHIKVAISSEMTSPYQNGKSTYLHVQLLTYLLVTYLTNHLSTCLPVCLPYLPPYLSSHLPNLIVNMHIYNGARIM